MNMVAILGFELLDELGHDRQQNFARSVFVQRPKLVDSLLRASLAAGQQVGNGAVTLCVPDLGIALVLAFHKVGIAALIELPFHI